MKMKIIAALTFSIFLGANLLSFTPQQEREASLELHFKMKESSIFKHLKWRCAGPVFQGGRISDIAVHPRSPFIIYASAGSGNLWKSVNNGTTWEPIFENESTFAIGDIAISESNPDILWVGSGEELMARSSYAGTGVFKSLNGGKTWQNMGLHDSHHIGRIVIHPQNPDIVYVAALGHEYTFNEERGLFKTTDGGKTWKKVLYINEKVGVVDVVMDPANNNTLLAAAWERDRKAWNNFENGPDSGIYKTIDAGRSWKKLANGFPQGKYVGRIGLAIAPSNPNVVYALLDNQEAKPMVKKKSKKGLMITDLEKMLKEDFLKIEKEKLERFLKENYMPGEYTVEVIKDMVKKGELTPKKLAKYLLEVNPVLKIIKSNVKGAEVYRSDDKGETWKKVNENYFEYFYFTYGYGFGEIQVSPDDENNLYILGFRLLASKDGGKTFRDIATKDHVHVDHHTLWINPGNPDHIINGNDGGVYLTYDHGETWQHINNIPIAEFYAISVDMAEPYNIYGGTQDYGVIFGPSDYIPEQWVPDPWKYLGIGDGSFVFIDPGDSNTVYFILPFGALYRRDSSTEKINDIMPKTRIGEPVLRCNWVTPFIISQHNRLTLYFGAQRLFKSLNRGDTWHRISPDLTTNPGPEKQGDVVYGTITTISESPLQPGLIYVGTDDGNIQVTQNDGVTWRKIDNGLPDRWVSRVTASRYDKGLIYAALTGYRQDDFKCYVYKSTDFGKTWTSIRSNLPDESVNVIREAPGKKNILYVGTDLGIYVTIDNGNTWHSLCGNLPTTPVHDLLVHPRDNELVIGTHGRGVFILDAVPIQNFLEKTSGISAHLFEVRSVTLPVPWNGFDHWAPVKHRNAYIYYYLEKAQKKVKISILDNKNKVIKEHTAPNYKGLNCVKWDLSFEGCAESTLKSGFSGMYVKSGTYKVQLEAGRTTLTGKIDVKKHDGIEDE